MSWDDHHSRSEQLAGQAESARRAGDSSRARQLYARAAMEEARALDEVPVEKQRTRGITAVSAVALTYKAQDYDGAERLAYEYLAARQLPNFAEVQLRDLLPMIWNARAAQNAGIQFVPGDVVVSVKGGEIVHGGAPLELILRKIEGIEAVLFRTVEMLLKRPFRKRGAPENEVQSMFRPWLFQAPAGSYQFAVRVQEPPQMDLWKKTGPDISAITATFFRVLQASATDPIDALPQIVPDREYRGAFLNLSRNLAPTGKTFERLEIHDAGAPGEPIASFVPETRQLLNSALRASRPPQLATAYEQREEIRGILRAVHLDQDWLEVATSDAPARHIRVGGVGDVLDDVIGPMVNRKVVVTVITRGGKRVYRDIEVEE